MTLHPSPRLSSHPIAALRAAAARIAAWHPLAGARPRPDAGPAEARPAVAGPAAEAGPAVMPSAGKPRARWDAAYLEARNEDVFRRMSQDRSLH
ncbi:hypothetical protein [Sinomonas halotolerans]|uniref:Uncharacterized protein n=1 Tax=Sinomonas halotolerans TaxID=1644133 RepID=A0ABU9X248_9MICC